MPSIAPRPSTPARRRRDAVARRFGSAGPLTYLFLLAGRRPVSIFPLYWSFVVASHDNSPSPTYPPVLTPGDHLLGQHQARLQLRRGQLNFWTGPGELVHRRRCRSPSRSSSSATLAGFAFAKLVPRRTVLLVVVIATMLVPVQLGVIPLYIEMIHLGWTEPPAGGDRAEPRHRVRRLPDAPVHRQRRAQRAARRRAASTAVTPRACSGTSSCRRCARPRRCSGCSRS